MTRTAPSVRRVTDVAAAFMFQNLIERFRSHARTTRTQSNDREASPVGGQDVGPQRRVATQRADQKGDGGDQQGHGHAAPSTPP